jgi:hypothetical protein
VFLPVYYHRAPSVLLPVIWHQPGLGIFRTFTHDAACATLRMRDGVLVLRPFGSATAVSDGLAPSPHRLPGYRRAPSANLSALDAENRQIGIP